MGTVPELMTLAGFVATAVVFVQLAIQHKKIVQAQKLIDIEISGDRAVALVSQMSAPYIPIPRQYDEHGPYRIAGKAIDRSICSLISENQVRPLINPRPLYKPAPSYPERARQRQITGYVDFCFILKKNGSVDIPMITAEVPEGYGFAQAALSVFSKWTFEHSVSNGAPLSQWAIYRVSFQLPE
jgi:hypothetical protein